MKTYNVEPRSDAWYQLRAGRPTASEFSRLITSTGDVSKSLPGYALTLAAEKYAGRPIDAWEGNAWTERGREMEEEAIRLYQFANDADVTELGFVTDDLDTTGCSPDGLVGDDGLVEVKCLKAENHVKAILYFQKNGRCPTDYVQQTQGQLLITGRKWCDLIFFHPELPLLTIRQTPDATMFYALKATITAVCAERDQVLASLRRQAGTSAPIPSVQAAE